MPGNFIQLDQGVPALDKNKKPEEQIEALRSYLKGFMEQLRYELRRMNGETRAIGTASKTASRNPEDYGYPIGSVYISTRAISPEHFFGGTWVQLQDRFLLAAGETYAAGTEGGSAEAVVPYHRHSVSAVSGGITGGSHSHGTGDSTRQYFAIAGGDITNDTAATLSGSGFKYPRVEETTSWNEKNTTASTTHTHDLPSHNTDYAGASGNAAGANLPPYMTVYMWERTE